MAKRVLILGAGFGGVSAAHRLRSLLAPTDEIVVADRATHFMMGFRKISAVIGREPMEDGHRPLANLERFGIRFVHGTIGKIEPASRAAEVDGERIEADAMLVALGAEVVPGAVPGLAEHGHNFYSAGGVAGAAAALGAMQAGRVVIGIFGVPFKCSAAPYELALLAAESLRARRSKATFAVFTPQPSSLPVAGKMACDALEERLAGSFIDFFGNTKAERVEKDRVVLAGGGEVPFDLLLAVPPHRVPGIAVDAGLAEAGGWVKANPRTLATPVDGVWAAGDVVGMKMGNGQPVPKAGVIAENEGLVAAERIAAHLAGRTPDATWDGSGGCYLEVGNGMAMMVRGQFLAEPEPIVELSSASPELLEEKHAYERSRLEAWFGA